MTTNVEKEAAQLLADAIGEVDEPTDDELTGFGIGDDPEDGLDVQNVEAQLVPVPPVLSVEEQTKEIMAAAVSDPVPRATAEDAGKAIFMSMNEVNSVAAVVMASRLVPNLKSVEEAAVKIMLGRELGITPMKACQDLYVVHGRVSMAAGLMAAVVKGSEGYTYRVKTHTNDACSIQFYEKSLNGDEWEEAGLSEFTMDDARTAGLVKAGSGWAKYPKNMLFARALSNGAKWYCPDLFAGSAYTPEELESSFIGSEPEVQQVLAAGPYPTLPPASPPTPTPAQTEPEPAGPVALERTEFTEEMKKAPVNDLRKELCPAHGEEFFMAGRMKSPAHKLPGNQWCNWKDISTEWFGRVNTEFAAISLESADEKEQWIAEAFPDLAGVKATKYRIQDLFAIANQLKDEREALEESDEG